MCRYPLQNQVACSGWASWEWGWCNGGNVLRARLIYIYWHVIYICIEFPLWLAFEPYFLYWWHSHDICLLSQSPIIPPSVQSPFQQLVTNEQMNVELSASSQGLFTNGKLSWAVRSASTQYKSRHIQNAHESFIQTPKRLTVLHAYHSTYLHILESVLQWCLLNLHPQYYVILTSISTLFSQT